MKTEGEIISGSSDIVLPLIQRLLLVLETYSKIKEKVYSMKLMKFQKTVG